MSTLAVSSVSSMSVTDSKPLNNKGAPSLWGVFARSCAESSFVKDLAKAFGYGVFWVRHAVSQISPASLKSPSMEALQSASGAAKDVKNFLSVAELPAKCNKLFAGFRSMWAQPSVSSAAKLGSEVSGIVNSAYDGLELTSKFTPIPSCLMRKAAIVNSAATLYGAGKGAVDEVSKAVGVYHQETSAPNQVEWKKNQMFLSALKVVKCVSYALVGALGLASFSGALTVPVWGFTALLTSGLGTTFGARFFEKLNPAEDKMPKAVV